jgi:hypothetical protein
VKTRNKRMVLNNFFGIEYALPFLRPIRRAPSSLSLEIQPAIATLSGRTGMDFTLTLNCFGR